MAIEEPLARARLGVRRVLDLLLHCDSAWDEIDEEPATIRGLFGGYVLPLALIGPVCGFIGLSVLGLNLFGVTFRPNPAWLAVQALTVQGLALLSVYLVARLIAYLAPRYGGVGDRTQAYKLAAYGSTPTFVAGVFDLVPQMGLVALLAGLYSLYLVARGLPRLMRIPEPADTRLIALTLLAATAGALVTGAAGAAVLGLATPQDLGDLRRVSGRIEAPGGGTVDLDRLRAETRKLDEASRRIQAGESIAVSADTLKPLLPATLGGLARGDVRGETAGIAGAKGSQAEADYAGGGRRIELQITDLGDAGALAGLASAFDIRSDRKTDDGQERIGKTDGRLTREVYDAARRRGEYGVLVAERFMVRARGEGVAAAQLKAAVDAVDLARLESMAKAP